MPAAQTTTTGSLFSRSSRRPLPWCCCGRRCHTWARARASAYVASPLFLVRGPKLLRCPLSPADSCNEHRAHAGAHCLRPVRPTAATACLRRPSPFVALSPVSRRYPPLRCVPTAEVMTTLLRVSWGQARTPFLPCARYSGKFRLRHRWHCNEGCFVRESESRRLCSDRQAAAPEENDSVIRRQIFSYFFSFLKSRARARA